MFAITMPTLGLLIGILARVRRRGHRAQVAGAIGEGQALHRRRPGGGRGDWHVIFRHIVPNVLPLSFLYMMFGVTEAISLEATLSFFGLLNVPMSWGIMINTRSDPGLPAGRAPTTGGCSSPPVWR